MSDTAGSPETTASPAERVELIATLTDPGELAAAPEALLARATMIEVRADLVGDLDPTSLRDRFSGRLIYTLRSTAEGGRAEDSPSERRRRLQRAAQAYDLIDLEAARDLDRETLAAIPGTQRVLSWHGEPLEAGQLAVRLAAMDQHEAVYRKLVSDCRRHGQELAPLELLGEIRRTDVAAFALGAIGCWTRVVALQLGAPLVFGSLSSTPAAPGQPTLERLVLDFDLPHLRAAHALYGIAGRPVMHSLSPRLHNAAYRSLGLEALYVPFYVEQFGDFWLEIVESDVLEGLGLPLRGLSVTAPLKDAALAVAGASSPRAQALECANTLALHRGVWEAESTDPEGVRLPLERRGIGLAGARAAVLGCGGAGRAAALGLARAGAEVTLFNRSRARGTEAAELLGLEFLALEDLRPDDFDVLVNATAVGHGAEDAPLFDPDRTAAGAAIVEMVYADRPTALERQARAAGRTVVGGREVLLWQAVEQFRLLTGRELPIDVAAAVLGVETLPQRVAS